ncbi:voltage-dependent calcium channel gamma-7 subunit-like isoform X1 [Lineus longissimus]|uniref:voltage-dependent calcium channel gamma-7 subunit-like isoform X1 n=1 Tax=Lineus longissimus TaxID=88925 RepID=UPI002B4F3A8F
MFRLPNMHCTSRMLGLIALFLGASAAALLALSVATDFWLQTKEILRSKNQTTSIYKHFGFWRMCTQDINTVFLRPTPSDGQEQQEPETELDNENQKGCENIVYFSSFEESDPLMEGPGFAGSAAASVTVNPAAPTTDNEYLNIILESIKTIAPMPGISLLLLVAGFVTSALGHLKKDCKTIIAAVIYIVSGMILALGIILFISKLNDEIRHVPRPGADEEPMFAYQYSFSFYLCGSAFIASQSAAVCCISLYLKRHSEVDDMIRLIPGLESKAAEVVMNRDSNVDSSNSPLHLPHSPLHGTTL